MMPFSVFEGGTVMRSLLRYRLGARPRRISAPTGEVLGPLLDAARQLGAAERSIGLRLEPNVPQRDRGWTTQLRSLGMHATWPPSQPRSSWVLDIAADEDVLLAGMKQKTR